MQVDASDGEVSPEEYVQVLVAAVEARVRATLRRVPSDLVLRPPGEVADVVLDVFERERARLNQR